MAEDTATAEKPTGTRKKGGKPSARPAPRPAADYTHDPADSRRAASESQAAEKPAAHKPPQAAEAKAETPPAATTPTREPEPDKGNNFPKRLTLPLSKEDDRELKLAKVDDDIETVVRIRAMIKLWREDERIRARIDRTAHKLR